MRTALRNLRASRFSKSQPGVRAMAMALAGILLVAIPTLAERTRWWRQNSFEDLDKGTAKGVSIRSDGKIFLAPRFAEFADANLAYVLAMRADAKGNLYAAGGSNAKVLRLDASGKMTTVFESSELAAQTLALDSAGNLFVGTSPDGKVYKVTPAGQSSVFFDPKTKYIWDLAVDRDGTVFVATGDMGKIFAVTPDGKGQIFYSSQETHVRALAIDSSGNILAGTEPSGLVLRISKAADTAAQKTNRPNTGTGAENTRQAFVLYQTSKKEITALLQDAAGNLYVAAVGEKTAPGSTPLRPNAAPGAPGGTFTITGGDAITIQQTQGQAGGAPVLPFPAVNSSSVYRIADGSPTELWSSSDEVAYSLGFLPNGKLLVGTGNRGALLQLDANNLFLRMVKLSSGQVTSIVSGPGGKVFLASANPGKIFALGPDSEPEGTYESQPYDARMFSQWGRLQWWGQNGAGPNAGARNTGALKIDFYARSGNTSDPNINWSPWAGPYSNPAGDKVDCPASRFIQWKAVLHSGAGAAGPELDWVNVAYLPKNVAPEVTGIAVQSPGTRAQGLSSSLLPSSQTSVQLRFPQPAVSTSGFNATAGISLAPSSGSSRSEVAPQGYAEKGYQTVLWTAEDDNDDQLEFTIYYRGENESAWKLLKDKVTTRFYSWDTTGMPDGAYYLKVVATDAPSNPAGQALTAERESDRFEVDNTPPAVSQLSAETAGNSRGSGDIHVRFQASDPSSAIARAQYSLDAGDWTLVFPTGGLSDAPRENYDFQISKVSPGEHSITVRVYDQFENVASAKASVRVSSSGN